MTLFYKLIFFNIIIFTLFTGCTPPSAMSFFKKDELKANAIQYTRKSDINHKGEVEAILTATYLNSVDSDFDDENQNFIVGVFITRDHNKEKNRYLNNKNFKLSMNGQKAFYQKELNEQHKMFGHLPLYNFWAKYYLVKFPKNDKELKLELKLESKKHKEDALIEFEAE